MNHELINAFITIFLQVFNAEYGLLFFDHQ